MSGKITESGWTPLPGGLQSNGVYLKRLNRRKPYLIAALLSFLLASGVLAVLIY